jgi:hypothetical protein
MAQRKRPLRVLRTMLLLPQHPQQQQLVFKALRILDMKP